MVSRWERSLIKRTKKKVFRELKADFTRNWQTQDNLLRQSDV